MSKKLKILVLTHTLPTKHNPIASVFLLNHLDELKKFCKIKIIFPHAYVPKIKAFNPYHRFSEIPAEEKVNGMEVYHPKYFMMPRVIFKLKLLNFYLPFESFFSYYASKKLAEKIVEEWDPDIIHMHGSLSEGLLGSHIKKKYSVPLCVTVYGEDITRLAHEFPSSILTKSTLRNSDVIICQSDFLKRGIESLGIKDKKFHIIPMGARLDRFKPKDNTKSRKQLNLPKGKKIILFVGHLFTRKGVEYLIKAMKIITKKEKNILCLIIGRGDLDSGLRKLASDLDLCGNITFLGMRTNDEVADYMNACDLFVLPSLNEGLPVVLCEALACGKPVVATNVAGTPELVNSDVGFLVKPKDVSELAEKIILAMNRKWNKKKLLARAAEFSVSASVKKLMKVYESFVKK